MLSVNTLLEKRIQELSLLPTAFEIDWDNDQMVENYPFNTHFIPHDRIDRYTGIDINGEKVFQRDRIVCTKDPHPKYRYDSKEMCVNYKYGQYYVGLTYKLYWYVCVSFNHEHCKIIGIQGVKDEG
jgi:hypothetical protein